MASSGPSTSVGPVQGHEQIAARLQPACLRRLQRAEAVLQRHQGVDHRVADEVHALLGNPLGAQVLDRLVAVQEEVVGEPVGDDPVDLLGHRAVEAAQPRLDVGERHQRLGGDQRSGQGRVDVAGDDHQVGPLGLDQRLEALDHPGGLLRVGARSPTSST